MEIKENEIIKISVQEFKSKNPRSVKNQSIAYYHDEIIELRNDGYKLKDIVEFLSQNGFKTSPPNLSKYIKRHSIDKQKVNSNISASNQKTKSPITLRKEKQIQSSEEKISATKKTKYQPDWAKKKGLATPEELLSEE